MFWKFGQGFVPEGRRENSPAFQRRGKFRMAQVPQGRLNGWHAIRQLQYLKGQEEHHRQMTFQEESLALLKKHRIEHPNRFEQLLYRAVSLINRGYWIGYAPLWDGSEHALLFTNDPT